MHHLILIILLLVALPAHAQLLYGRVVAITDGDTVKVLDESHKELKICLAGIDAPERKQPFGQRAKQSLSDLVYGKTVEVKWHKYDRYKRLIGKILIGGKDANLEMNRGGLAWHHKKYQSEQSSEDQKAYSKAEDEARQSGRGLWADPAPISPSNWHKGSR